MSYRKEVPSSINGIVDRLSSAPWLPARVETAEPFDRAGQSGKSSTAPGSARSTYSFFTTAQCETVAAAYVKLYGSPRASEVITHDPLSNPL